MNFSQTLVSCFKNYANPHGRASRAEFWYWQLFGLIVILAGELLDLLVFSSSGSQTITSVLSLFFFIPNYAVQIRRLHDVDRNGWWLLIGLTIIGFFYPLLYWACMKGTTGPNRFGEDPTQAI